MGQLFSQIMAKYVSSADENLERVQNAILAAKGNAYTANQATSDAVAIWANFLECWTASFDFGVAAPSRIELYGKVGVADSNSVAVKIPSGLGAPTKYDLQFYLNDNTHDIPKAKLQLTSNAGPPQTLTVQLVGLSNLKAGVYAGPLVFTEHLAMVLFRVQP